MISPDIFVSPRLKVQRAYSHIDELRRVTEPLSPEFYSIVLDNDSRAINGYSTLNYEPTQPIPELLALMIGDAVHNLRSALDHLATAIVRTVDPKAEVHFPMRKNRKDLVAETKPLPTIEQALPGATELLLNELRPTNGPDESFWAFHALDNDDKHNLLIPTVTFARVAGLHIRSGPLNSFARFGGNAAKPIYIIKSGQPISVEGDINTTVEVKFGDGTPFKDDPVVPTLMQIGDVVTETLNAFERLINA